MFTIVDEDDKIYLNVKGLLAALIAILELFRKKNQRSEFSMGRIIR